jgi:hypothetical protein
MALLAGCEGSGLEPGPGLSLAPEVSCALPKTTFSVGEELPPPVVTIDNTTGTAIELVGPTDTVIACILVQPDGAQITMRIAMPTGRSPYDMPKHRLEAGASLTFTPRGTWTYRDGSGFVPYVFSRAGTYHLSCQYEDLTSNAITVTVK